ncbi:MAG: LSM domain-containing protein [Halobellus sp.]|uniref:LSM domain-containing protein n=1 Tax=Halobellus sp. TaxID=1979212 RepID=UPI0035D4F702
MSGRPLDVLEAALEDVVTITLKDGTAYYGTLAGYDQHMNAVLEPARDVDETLRAELEVTAVEDTTIIRGDNVVTIQV